jgi:hypothetical protein
MTHDLGGEELAGLVTKVFRPRPEDRALAVLADLPDAQAPDSDAWRARRAMALRWVGLLRERRAVLGLEAALCLYRNVRSNNADLPEKAWLWEAESLPRSADDPDPAQALPFTEIFRRFRLLIALTEFSATAPLKLQAKSFGFRAATMPGFSPAMIPALRLDHEEINRRVDLLKSLLDRAELAELLFRVEGGTDYLLVLDLRGQTAHASGGLLHEPGTAGNLPSGEAYIVPREGGGAHPSLSAGLLPVQFGDEVVVYEIEENRARNVLGSGMAARAEAALIAKEPAYGNIAELGFGVLAAFGVLPCGSMLLDEKLGLHIAFGRSDHFGGRVGPRDFSSPEAVVHIDRIYLPSVQPQVHVLRVDLRGPRGETIPLMRRGEFVVEFTRRSAD